MGKNTNKSNIEAVVNAVGSEVTVDKRYDREENHWYITEKLDYRGENGVIVPVEIVASDEGDCLEVKVEDADNNTEYILYSLAGNGTEGIEKMIDIVVSGIVRGNRIHWSADGVDIAEENMDSLWIKMIPKGKRLSRKTVVTLYENEHDDIDSEVVVTDEYKRVNVIATVVENRGVYSNDDVATLNVRVIKS